MINRNSVRFIVILWSCIALIACQNTSIDAYQPKTLDERGAIDVIKQYRNSRNAFDLDQYLACLHPDGKFSFMGDHILSKPDLEKKLPRFWERLHSEDAAIFPLMRESITGDFFDNWRFDDIGITINDSTAEVTVICNSSWVCKQLHIISMVKEDGDWRIFETSWRHF